MASNGANLKYLLPFVDLTASENDIDYTKASEMDNSDSLRRSLKRKMSDSFMDGRVDHASLMARIEEDVLQPTRLQQNWSFGSIGQSFKVSKPAEVSTTCSKGLLNQEKGMGQQLQETASMGIGRIKDNTYTPAAVTTQSTLDINYQRKNIFAAMREKSSTSSVIIGDSDNDSEDDVIDIEALYPVKVPTRRPAIIPPGANVINLNEETGNAITDQHRLDHFDSDYLDEAGFKAFFQNLNSAKSRSDSSVMSIKHGNHNYKPGKSAQMNDGTFIRIKSIQRDSQGVTWLIGDHLIRTCYQGLKMPKRRNDLVWLSVTNDIHDPKTLMVKRKLVDAIRISRVNFTNQQHKELNTHTHANSIRNPKQDAEMGELFCRLRRIEIRTKESNKFLEESIEILSDTESDEKYRLDPATSRDEWRGIQTIPGGSFLETRQVITLDGKPETVLVRKYSYGEAFSGAGGTTRGVTMAGVHAAWGFDCDKDAVATYRSNFAENGTRCFQESVDEFILRISRLSLQNRQKYMVDILHISPPCQPFCPAHTRINEENDAKNQAALFSVLQLLQTIRPRVVTIEETEGLISRHGEWFSALINIFVYVGYSVRWRKIQCEKYGVPQKRTRLFIIASGPGEKLPQIAKPTHGDGLQPLVTIRDVLNIIPPNALNHQKTYKGDWPKPAFSPDQQANCVTCGGGKNYHPSGKRNYTNRELACFQTFPLWHLFDPGLTIGRKQVGNAVPPRLAKVMYHEILKSLKETDGIDSRR